MAKLQLERTPVREQEPQVRAANFQEVCYGYNVTEAQAEAARCLDCKKPSCVPACPVHVKIPEFIKKIVEGDFLAAADKIWEDSSLPAVCGRVCPQETQCEGSCIVGRKGDPLAIGKLERFAADYAREKDHFNPQCAAPNGKKVAIVGSGPSGLACATDLARLGYKVKIFEALHRAGGVLQYGIPEFRLPKQKVVDPEIENVRRLGVEIETDVVVGRTLTIDSLLEQEGYDAVFVGSGAGLPRFMGIPGENLNGVLSANELLTRSNLMKAFDPHYDTPVYVGKQVVVVGGGNVAMDAARTALRLGAHVTLVYRRSEAELPARREEVHHAKEEGIEFCLLTNPIEVLGTDEGWVRAVKVVKMELGAPDASGRRSPIPIQGSEYEIPCDVVVMALGTSPNPLIAHTTPHLDVNKHGCLVVDEAKGQTSRPNVFAGGDAVSGAATVILAMGAGRSAAAGIHAYLQEKERQ